MEWSLNFMNIFLDLIQLSKQGALQEKKIFQNFLHLKKPPEYCKTQSHHGNILSCFGAHNTPLNLNQQRKKSFRKIRKTHKNPFMFIKDHHRILQQYVAEHSANFNNVLKQERDIKNN